MMDSTREMIYASQLDTPRQPASELRPMGGFAAAVPHDAPLIRPGKWAQLESQVSLANGDRPVTTILSLRAVNGNAHLQTRAAIVFETRQSDSC